MDQNSFDCRIYQKLPQIVLGFHGCDKNTFKNVIIKGQHLKNSNNNYDWLGHGIYFWENSYVRALDWAKKYIVVQDLLKRHIFSYA